MVENGTGLYAFRDSDSDSRECECQEVDPLSQKPGSLADVSTAVIKRERYRLIPGKFADGGVVSQCLDANYS